MFMYGRIILRLTVAAVLSTLISFAAFSSPVGKNTCISYYGDNFGLYLSSVLRNNDEIKFLEFSLKKNMESIRKELAYQRMSAGISGGTEQWIDGESSDGYTNTSTAEIYLRQQIELSGKFSAHMNYLIAGYKSAEFAFRDKVNTILARAAAAYVEASVSKENVAIQEQVLADRRESLRVTKHKCKEGMAPELDVIRAGQQVDDAEALLENAGRNYANALAAMRKYCGEDFDVQPLELEKMYVEDFSLEKALAERADLSALRMDMLAAKMNGRLAAKGLTPTFQIRLSWGYANYRLGRRDTGYDNYEGKLSFSADFPIFDGGRTKHQKKEGEYLILETERRIASLEENIAEEVDRAGNDLKSALLVERIKMRSRLAAQKTLHIAEEMYKDGLLGQIDLINAQESDQNAQTAYIQAFKDLADACIEQRRATGGFCGGDLPLTLSD